MVHLTQYTTSSESKTWSGRSQTRRPATSFSVFCHWATPSTMILVDFVASSPEPRRLYDGSQAGSRARPGVLVTGTSFGQSTSRAYALLGHAFDVPVSPDGKQLRSPAISILRVHARGAAAWSRAGTIVGCSSCGWQLGT
jgi:hypothetical protein